MYPGGRVPWMQPDADYWPGWESHYAPVAKSHPRLHHRNNYAPPAYSAVISASDYQHRVQNVSYPNYPRQRRTLLDPVSPPLPGLLRTADALFPPRSVENGLLANFGYPGRKYLILGAFAGLDGAVFII